MSWTGKQRAATKSCPKLCGFCPRMQNRSETDRYVLFPTYALAVTPKMSPQVRSCPIHADSGFLWACFESIRFAELIVHERQVQATIHFCPFPRGQNLPNKHVWTVPQICKTHDDGHLWLKYGNWCSLQISSRIRERGAGYVTTQRAWSLLWTQQHIYVHLGWRTHD